MAHRYWYCWDGAGDWNANDGSALANWFTDPDHTQNLAGTSYSPASGDILHFDGGWPRGDWNGITWPETLTIAGIVADNIDCHNGSIEAWGFTTSWTVTNSLVNNSNFIFRGNCSGASTVTGLVAGPGANVGNGRTFTLCASEGNSGTITCGNNCTITGHRRFDYCPQKRFVLSAGSGLSIVGEMDLTDLDSGDEGWTIGAGASITAHLSLYGPITFSDVPTSLAGGIRAKLGQNRGDISIPAASPVNGSMEAEGQVGVGAGSTIGAGVVLTSSAPYMAPITGGVAVGENCTFLGDMSLTINGNDSGISVGNGWKVNNGAAGGSVNLDAEYGSGYQTDVTLGSPNAGQSRVFQSVTVKGKDNRTTDISGLGSFSIKGSFSVSLSGSYGGGAYISPGTVTLAKKGATASAPGLSVVESIPVAGSGGGVVNIG